MTNYEALQSLARSLSHIALSIDQEDAKFEDELSRLVFEWGLVPQLEGVAEVVAKAWVERHPSSQRARNLASDQLVGVGKVDEARAIYSGAAPNAIDDASESELLRLRQNLARAAEGLGLANLKR